MKKRTVRVKLSILVDTTLTLDNVKNRVLEVMTARSISSNMRRRSLDYHRVGVTHVQDTSAKRRK